MRLPPEYEWVCPGASPVWHIRRVGADRMLCGGSFFTGYGVPGYCPTVQPEDPSPQCGRCLAKLREMA